jgi:hypothetical protein
VSRVRGSSAVGSNRSAMPHPRGRDLHPIGATVVVETLEEAPPASPRLGDGRRVDPYDRPTSFGPDQGDRDRSSAKGKMLERAVLAHLPASPPVVTATGTILRVLAAPHPNWRLSGDVGRPACRDFGASHRRRRGSDPPAASAFDFARDRPGDDTERDEHREGERDRDGERDDDPREARIERAIEEFADQVDHADAPLS